jgi:glycosyltransferase involved in cell wall biosynthesis
MTTANSSVSILIPVYNRQDLIGPCIQSALDQTLSPLEIVVVDNASTDDTWAVCQAYAQRDGRVRVFRNEHNLGPVRNWQRCIAAAQGQFGKFLFSDDELYPTFLEKTRPYLDDPAIGFVFSAVNLGADLQTLYAHEYAWRSQPAVTSSRIFIEDELLDVNVPWSPGCALLRLADLKHNLMLTVPSPSIKDFVDHGAGPDVLIYLLTAQQYPQVAHVAEPLTFFRHHPSAIGAQYGGNLIRPYQQARLWFAATYTDCWLTQRTLARTWLILVKSQRRWISPHRLTRQFLQEDDWSWRAVGWYLLYRRRRRKSA